MKKLLILAMAALPMLFACNKGSNVPESMDKPAFTEQSAKIELDNPISVNTKDNRRIELTEINFLRSGRYVAEGYYVLKSEAEIVYLSGSYTFTSGSYVTTGDLTVTVTVSNDKEQVTIGNEVTTVNYTHTDIKEGSLMDQVARSWKFDHAILSFDALGGRARYDSFGELVDDIVAHKINISEQTIALMRKHEINEISVDAGIVTVTFTQAEPFKGQFMLNDSGTFSFEFEGMTTDVFKASARGQLTVTEDTAKITMTVESNLKDLGNGAAEVYLKAVK
jgi:hypothetical protein